jgi:excisionase family DNA binding protein
MATRKFITLEEAASMLGVSTDTVSEMRDRGKIHGYRDGASWKFKPEEVERVIAERDAADEEGDFAEVNEDPDSILLSEVELGQSDESTSSTIIGGKPSRNPAESDIKLAADSAIDIDLDPAKNESSLDLDSALTLEPSSGSDVLDVGSGVKSDAGSGVGSGLSPMFDDLDTLDLDLPSAADSGISSKILVDVPPADGPGASKTVIGAGGAGEGSGLGLASEDELALGEAADDEILLDVDSGGSAIDLAEDMDDDLVLGGSSHGDISRTGDSGISLLNPSDSGLSLESAPMELGGSGIVDSLNLGDDDLLLDEETPAAAGADAGISGIGDLGTEAADDQSDDDFLLTPLEEGAAEESDSGSQVIALDDDVEFEEAGVGALEEGGGGGGLLEDDLGEGFGGGAALGAESLAAAPAHSMAPAAAGGPMMTAAAPEAPFSMWNVLSLALCSVMLLMCGMFMFDLLRNMWSWNEAYSVNSSMMDMVLSWFEG